MTSRTYVSRSVRDPLSDFSVVIKHVNDHVSFDDLSQTFTRRRRRISKTEFKVILREMEEYGFVRSSGNEYVLGEIGRRIKSTIVENNKKLATEIVIDSLLNKHQNIMDFICRISNATQGPYFFPRAPGASEFKKTGHRFTAANSDHRKMYIDYFLGLLRKNLTRVEKRVGIGLGKKEWTGLKRHVYQFVGEKVSQSYSVNQRNVIDWSEQGVTDFLLKMYFDESFKNIPEFEVWRDRLFFLGLVNYTVAYPFLRGGVIYSISRLSIPRNRINDYETYSLRDGSEIYVHNPRWQSSRSDFMKTLKQGYQKLSRFQKRSYVKISDLRDIVCCKMRIHDQCFDTFLTKLYFESTKEKGLPQISLDTDIYPGRDHWKKGPLNMGRVIGKRTIISIR